MDDLLGLVVLIVFYVVAAASRKNKKNRKGGAKPSQKRPAREPWDEIRENLTRAMETLEAAKEAPKPLRAEGALHQEQPCQTQSVHLHEATQQQMLDALEGEDPCHVGGANADDANAGGSALTGARAAAYAGEETEQSELAQDLLRGVIMSEILTRPCNRPRGWNVKRGA